MIGNRTLQGFSYETIIGLMLPLLLMTSVSLDVTALMIPNTGAIKKYLFVSPVSRTGFKDNLASYDRPFTFSTRCQMAKNVDPFTPLSIINRADATLTMGEVDQSTDCATSIMQDQSRVERYMGNRRQILASIMITTSVALQMGNSDASAKELTWAESPVNKRSGITLFRAEENGYNVRFITYLSRFLLSFDYECQKWWIRRAKDIPAISTVEQVDMKRFQQFGAFSTSIEIGLQEYQGNDGSQRLMKNLLKRYCPDIDDVKAMREESGMAPFNSQQEAKQMREIKEARRQIALLFSLLEVNQPVEEITKTLAAIDNATISEISIIQRGTGYSNGYGVPNVQFPAPEAGEGYETATGRASLRPNGRILRIDLSKRGFGYTRPPTIAISEPLAVAYGSPTAKAATAEVSIFRDGVSKGRVERIHIIDPGQGYNSDEPIRVTISSPDISSEDGGEVATARAVLEYEVDEIQIVNPGSGYAAEKPIEIEVDPPPLTARVNMNDPMMAKFISSSLDRVKYNSKDKSPTIYDPSTYSGNVWKEAKVGGGGGCIGRACYDQPVIAIAYPKAKKTSYSSFRKDGDLNSKISGVSSGEDNAIPILPFWSGGSSSSSQLLMLLPSGIGVEYNEELGRYEVAAAEDIDSLGWNSVTPGKPIDSDFGPRGRSPVEKQKDLNLDTFLRFAASGALCSSSVHLSLTPIDVVKTKVQTDPVKYPGFFTTYQIMAKEQGIGSFFAGWAPTFAGFFVAGGLSYSFTEFFRRYYSDLAGELASSYEVPIILFAAASSSVIVSAALAPFEAVRIRSVAQPDYAPNAIQVLSRMIKDEGLLDLFSAVPAFLFKEIPFTMAKFVVFDLSTEYLYDTFPAAREDLQLSLLVSLVGGTFGGIAASIVSNPADATISEMKKSKSDESPVVVALGLFRSGGIYRGLGIRMFFYSILVSLQFVVYDAIRFSLGIGSDDLKLYLDVLGGALSQSGGPV